MPLILYGAIFPDINIRALTDGTPTPPPAVTDGYSTRERRRGVLRSSADLSGVCTETRADSRAPFSPLAEAPTFLPPGKPGTAGH